MSGSRSTARSSRSRSPGPSGATRSPSRCMPRLPMRSKARRRSSVRVDHLPRRRPGFRRRQRPCRFPRALPRDDGRNSGVAISPRPRRNAKPRWSPRSTAIASASARRCCSIATSSSPTRRAFLAAVRRSRARARSGELAPAAAARGRRRAARYLLLAEPFGADEALTSARQPSRRRRAGSTRPRRDRREPARQAAPRRCARPSGCSATAAATKFSNG